MNGYPGSTKDSLGKRVPYAPYKPGPMSMAIAILVAVIALVTGVILMVHHKDGRGVIFVAAAAATIAVIGGHSAGRSPPSRAGKPASCPGGRSSASEKPWLTGGGARRVASLAACCT
jgi:hypothetical protein